jgi:hypothetical protein
MTIEEILRSAPTVLVELNSEFVRRSNDELWKDPKSQVTACLYLAVRSVSLLNGMGRLLTFATLDSYSVLARGFLEVRDLLLTFRRDDQGIRNKIGYWFEGKAQSPWKAEHKKSNEFWEEQGHPGADLNKKWSQMTTLSHPTIYAGQNSLNCARPWAHHLPLAQQITNPMDSKIPDYLVNIATVIVNATLDPPGLISLGLDLQRMPSIDSFHADVAEVVIPDYSKVKDNLPPDSYREE